MDDIRTAKIICTTLGALSLCGAQYAIAQAYPQHPVRVIVNLTPGGGVDTLARIVATHNNQVWNVPFVVDNRPGAGGNIGVETVVKSAPDGYTLLVGSTTIVTNAAVRPEGYNPVRDLSPVAKLTSNPYIVCVSSSLPVSSIKELIALAKTKSGGISFASSGTGGIQHLGGELLAMQAGVKMVHVPFKGVSEAYPPVISGQIEWVLGAPLSSMTFIRSGRIKGLAITSPTRSKVLPDMPTVSESGLAGYSVVSWFSMFAPAKVPAAIIDKLHVEALRAMQAPEVAKRMEAESTEVSTDSAAKFGEEVKSDYTKWVQVVQKSGIKF